MSGDLVTTGTRNPGDEVLFRVGSLEITRRDLNAGLVTGLVIGLASMVIRAIMRRQEQGG